MLDWSSIQLHHHLKCIGAKLDQKKWKTFNSLLRIFSLKWNWQFSQNQQIRDKSDDILLLGNLTFPSLLCHPFLIMIDSYWHLTQPCWWSPCSRWYAHIGSMRRECPMTVVVVRNAQKGLDPTPPLDCSHLTFKTDFYSIQSWYQNLTNATSWIGNPTSSIAMKYFHASCACLLLSSNPYYGKETPPHAEKS